jgi:hypothetical protein
MGAGESKIIQTNGTNISGKFNSKTKDNAKSKTAGTIITNKTNKKYEITGISKQSLTNRAKKLGSSAVKSVGIFGKKNNKQANNSIKITTTDIENVKNLFKLGSFDRDIIYRIFKENINNLSKEYSLTTVINSIKTKKTTISISSKFQEICNEYKDSNFILKEKNIVNKNTNVQRIGNNKSENNITNKYESYQYNLIKLFSAVYEYSISNKYKNNKTKFVNTPWKGLLADPNRELKQKIKKNNKTKKNNTNKSNKTPIEPIPVNNKN